MQAQTTQKLTYEEYLRLDAEAEEKREFYHGDLINMAGEQPGHRRIKTNLNRVVIGQEREGCMYHGPDTRVVAPGYGSGSYAYPDAHMVCGEDEWDRSFNPPVLLNPVLIVEVTSASTSARDYGAKLAAYFRIRSLVEYWVIDSERVRVYQYVRRADGVRTWNTYEDKGDVFVSERLGLEVALRDVYAGVHEG